MVWLTYGRLTVPCFEMKAYVAELPAAKTISPGL